jgi:cell division protein ZapA
MQVERSLKVRILDREYPLRVSEEDSEATREMAAYLNDRIEVFRKAHPDQPELTSAVIAALSITEELFTLRQKHFQTSELIEDEVQEMSRILQAALAAAAE